MQQKPFLSHDDARRIAAAAQAQAQAHQWAVTIAIVDDGGRTAFLSAPALDGMLEGGVPVMIDGHCIGAVGVSGVKSSEDAQIARAGIAALGS
jgi:glc operon protein GlcG